MFGIGFPELIIILLVALVVVGPERLPEMARKLGQTVNDLRRMYTNLRSELGPDFDEVENHIRTLRSLDPRRELDQIGRKALAGLTDDVVPEFNSANDDLRQQILSLQEELRFAKTQPAIQATELQSAVDPVANQQRLQQLSHDLLSDDLLDEPITDTTQPKL